jgi:hypothetical protein
MMQNNYIESISQKLEEASLILRHVIKLLNDGGFIDSNVRNDFIQSIQTVYNISLFMRWQSMEQIALKVLELSEEIKTKPYNEIVSTLEQFSNLLRQMRLLAEHFEFDNNNKKGKVALL